MKKMDIPPASGISGLTGIVNKIRVAPKRDDSSIPLDDETPVVYDKKSIVDISISAIDVSPFQPRILFNDEEIAELAESISVSGQVTPIIVRSMPNNRYELVGGERRIRALKLLNKLTVEAVIRDINEEDASILALIDNESRENLTDYERGKAYKSLIDSKRVASQTHLAHRIGKSNATITRCLSYFKLPGDVIKMLDDNPTLLGNKVVADFAKIAERGYPDVVIKHVGMISVKKYSQEVALNFAKSEVDELEGKKIKKMLPRQLISSGRPVAEFHFEGKRGVVLRCEKGVNPSVLIEKLEKLLASDPISFEE